MKKWKLLGKRAAAFLLGAVMAVNPGLAGTAAESLLGIVSYAEERTASVNATNLNVRSGPGTSYQALAKLSKGAPVTVLGEQTGTDGVVWYQIRYSGSGGEQTGYVSSKYIKFPTAIKSDSDFESYLTKQGFPESYKQGLRELHAQYPNWTFTAFQTNLDWNTALKNESVIGRNLVASSSISSWKSTETGAYDWGTGTWPGFDGSSWVQASSDIIAYYMDPRNFLNDKYIYQFMKQSYDSSLHTKTGLQNMVSGTFLSGTVSGGSSVSAGTGSSSGSSSSGSATGPEVRQVRAEAAPVCRLRLLRSAIIRRSGWQRPMDQAWREMDFLPTMQTGRRRRSAAAHRISHRGQPAARLEPPVAVQAHREAAQLEQLLVQPAAEEQVHREVALPAVRELPREWRSSLQSVLPM